MVSKEDYEGVMDLAAEANAILEAKLEVAAKVILDLHYKASVASAAKGLNQLAAALLKANCKDCDRTEDEYTQLIDQLEELAAENARLRRKVICDGLDDCC